jgi:hypothetical protein
LCRISELTATAFSRVVKTILRAPRIHAMLNSSFVQYRCSWRTGIRTQVIPGETVDEIG